MNEESWDEDLVVRMIADGIEESLHLDYKAAGSLAKQKKDEIVKDVTAFANSDGGVIIYGVREHSANDKKHLPERLDPIDRAEFSKEWLEHVIANAAPRMPNIRIHPIPISTDPAKCLYVVEIPKGETAHQSADCKYYRRYNFESVAMRDHEIRDVMNRIKVPRLEIEAYLGIRNPWEESSLIFKIRNVSNRIARNYAIAVKMPLKLDGVLMTPKDEGLLMDSDEQGHYFQFSLGNGKLGSPLFPKATVNLTQGIRCDVSRIEMKNGEPMVLRPHIDVRVFADEMVPLELQFDPKQIRGQWGAPTAITTL